MDGVRIGLKGGCFLDWHTAWIALVSNSFHTLLGGLGKEYIGHKAAAVGLTGRMGWVYVDNDNQRARFA